MSDVHSFILHLALHGKVKSRRDAAPATFEGSSAREGRVVLDPGTKTSMAALETHAAHDHPRLEVSSARGARSVAVRRARWLNATTIGWNGAEGVVALVAGIAAGSVSLVGFGFDSAIEVSAALVLTWRLRQERREGCTQDADARATRAIAGSFAVLAVYVALEAVRDLAGAGEPDVSIPGIVLATLSLVVMPVLARAKANLAPILGSTAAMADAAQTNLCALLSAVLLVGLGANWLLGWWWADPVAALGIAALAAAEARRAWRAEALEDTCCA